MTHQPGGSFFGTGTQQFVGPETSLGIPEVPEGQHLWTMMLTHRIDNPASWADTTGASDPRDRVLGLHNLMANYGPFCLICEELWTPQLEAKPCTGDPNEDGHG